MAAMGVHRLTILAVADTTVAAVAGTRVAVADTTVEAVAAVADTTVEAVVAAADTTVAMVEAADLMVAVAAVMGIGTSLPGSSSVWGAFGNVADIRWQGLTPRRRPG